MPDCIRHHAVLREDGFLGGYVVMDADGQVLAPVYSRDNEDEARQAKVLTKDDRHQHCAAPGTACEG